jgi:transposase-like protein
MNVNAPSKLVSELHCPDCKKPMQVRTVVPMFDGRWELSFECDQCGKASSVVHKLEDNPL